MTSLIEKLDQGGRESDAELLESWLGASPPAGVFARLKPWERSSTDKMVRSEP